MKNWQLWSDFGTLGLMHIVRKILKYVLRGLLGLLIAITLYLLLAVLGTWIATGKYEAKTHKPQNSLQIYVITNGLHTDFVVPLVHPVKDWRQHLDSSRFAGFYNHRYLSFGWGDKSFFLNSTQEGFPGLGTTLQAVLLPSRSLMHISFYRGLNTESEQVMSLQISRTQYRALVTHLFESFALTANQKFRYVANGYDNYDFFVEAHRAYHLFNTCNNWTNRGLKAMDFRTGIWTPFEQGVVYRLR